MKTLQILGISLLLLVMVPAVAAQDPTATPAADASTEPLDGEAMEDIFFVEFNRLIREEFDARALARNDILDEIAQSIAQDVGCTEESVNFDIRNSVLGAGYGLYPSENTVRTTRIPLLPIVNVRPIEEMARFYSADIYENNINQPGRFYREIGVGVAPCIAVAGDESIGSTQQYGLFVILGSQPDIVPVVIENGESEIEVETVPATFLVSVHQENTRQLDETFGRGESLRFSTAPLTDSDRSQPFESFIEVEFETCGENTLYYELTDINEIVVDGETSVTLVCGDE